MSRPTPDDRPRFFYGWIMLGVCTTAAICSAPGQTYSIARFNLPMQESLGLGPQTLSWLYLVGTLGASLVVPYAGALMDRRGPRTAMSAVVILLGLACVAAGSVTGPVTLGIAFFLLRLLGQGSMTLLAGNSLAMWFDRRLGTAVGLKAIGMAAAISLVPSINMWLIEGLGWRGAFVALGVIVWALMLPLLAIAFRNHPAEVGQELDGARRPEAGEDDADGIETPPDATLAGLTAGAALRTPAWWIATGALVLWGTIVTGAVFHADPIFVAAGLTPADAGHLFLAFGPAVAVTQLVAGAAVDRFPERWVLAAGCLLSAAAMATLARLAGPLSAWIAGAAFGLAQGTLGASIGPMFARYFGRAHLGKITGPRTTLMAAGSAFGPVAVSGGYAFFGSYEAILLVFAAACLPFAFLALAAVKPGGSQATPPA